MTKKEWRKLVVDEQTEYDKAKMGFKRIRGRNTFAGVIGTVVSAVGALLAVKAWSANRFNEGLEAGMDAVHNNRKDEVFPLLEDSIKFEEDKPTE